MSDLASASDRLSARAAEIADAESATLLANTTMSREWYERALQTLPLGVPSSFQAGDPYPIYIERGEGAHVWDVDGTDYLDFHGGFGVGVCGHAHPKIVEANPELHEWHTAAYTGRLPGLKWLRTLWLASLAGGPFEYTGRELRDAHFDLKISPAVFDEVAGELSRTLDDFKVHEREKGEVLATFAGWKGEVTAGAEPGEVNWRRWR